MTTNQSDQDYSETLRDAMLYVGNEAIMLARMEEFFSPQPARLWSDAEDEYMSDKLDNTIKHMGGPPKHFLIRVDDPPPECDTYPEAILRESIKAFSRARKSVCRAHLFLVGTQMLNENPDFLPPLESPDNTHPVQTAADNAFWEHAETAYIRLASYWDRVGQVLDFTFFRIRQFERDGFSAVMDRIRTNVLQMNTNLSSSGSWKALRAYQTSDRDDGLKWILRRRNITVHSLHLRPSEPQTDEVAFSLMYNHLEEKLNAKLAPRSPEEEVAQLQLHLSKAATLFREVLNVIEYGYYLYHAKS